MKFPVVGLLLLALCFTSAYCSAEEQDEVDSQEDGVGIIQSPWRFTRRRYFFCRRVRCAAPKCKNPIPSNPRRGKCCRSCPKKPGWPLWPRPNKCRYVRCARPWCRNPIPANPARGKCCSTCPIRIIRPIPTRCKKVLCVVPTCKNPIPANPSRGRCCATCPKPSSNLGTCPAVPPGRKGICAMLCFSDADCSSRQRCCSNGCGHQCTTVSTIKNPVCSLPVVIGRCRARIRRYYFDKRSGKCRTFFYGGCGGNGNNFTSLSACRRKCGGLFG